MLPQSTNYLFFKHSISLVQQSTPYLSIQAFLIEESIHNGHHSRSADKCHTYFGISHNIGVLNSSFPKKIWVLLILIQFKDEDYEVTTATTVEEIKQCTAAGSEKFDEANRIHIFIRPRKFRE